MTVVRELSDLARSSAFALFEGGRHGQGIELSFFVGNAPPGAGPNLHEHPYAEAFLVEEGQATFTVGDEQLVASGGQIVVVPPETPHKFVNSGQDMLRIVSIHPSPQVVQTDLPER